MIESGVGDRLQQEGLQHDYIDLRFNAEPHRLNIRELSRGRSVWVYAQHEIVKDLVAAGLGRVDRGVRIERPSLAMQITLELLGHEPAPMERAA